MATEVKKVAEQAPEKKTTEERVVHQTQQFWSKNSQLIFYVVIGIVVLVGGFFIYRNYFKLPAEEKAYDAIWKAQSLFRVDSFRLALNGDGSRDNPGFLKVISRNSGTKAANLAKFYAGSCYLQLGDYNNAIKYLEDFSTDQEEVKLRTYGLLGDAYSELGKNEKAIDNYKKAATVFEKDEANSSEYLYRLAQLYDKLGRTKDAVATFESLREKFPLSNRAGEAEKYLAKLGETK